MAALTPAAPALAGANPGFVAAASGGDTVPTGSYLLIVRNSHATLTRSVTIAVPGTAKYSSADAPDIGPVAVPALGFRIFGPFPRDLADDSDGRVHVTYSDATDVFVALVRI